MEKENILIDFTEVICPECGAERICYDAERSEETCKQCGLVLMEKIPMILHGGLRNPYEHHVGDSVNLARWDKRLTTYFPRRNVDSRKKKVPPAIQPLINRLRKWHNRFGFSKDRGLSIMLDVSRSFSLLLDTKRPVTDEAVLILRKFFKNNNLMGKSYESFIAAVFYAACKIKRNPRNIKDISDITSISKRDISLNYKFLAKTLKLQIPFLKLSEYLPRVSALSGVSMRVERRALKILNNAKEISGRNPWGIAGASIYIAAKEYGEDVTQREIADITDVTEVTIRERCKELKKVL